MKKQIAQKSLLPRPKHFIVCHIHPIKHRCKLHHSWAFIIVIHIKMDTFNLPNLKSVMIIHEQHFGGGQLWDWFCPHSVLTLPTKLAVDKEILFSLTIDYYTSSQYLKILNPYFSQSLNFIKWCQILCSFSHCSHVRHLLIRLRGFLLSSWLFMHCFIISFLGSLDV